MQSSQQKNSVFPRQLRAFVESADFVDLSSTAFRKGTLREIVLKSSRDDISEEMDNLWRAFRRALADALLSAARLEARAFREALTAVEGVLGERLSQREVLLLESLPFLFRDFLETTGVPTVYFYWGDRIRHYLLDEFQDTNTIQFKAFLPLLRKGQSKLLINISSERESLIRAGVQNENHFTYM